MDKRSILQKIKKAFSDVPYPYECDFYKAIADREYQEYIPTHLKKPWENISKDELIQYYDFIFFLNSGGVIYYLPSYMSLILKHDDVADHNSPQCFFMTIADLDLSLLSKEKIQAINEFLLYCHHIIHPKIELDDVLLDRAIENVRRAL